MNQRNVIVLKDKEGGQLLPMAGIWIENDAGRMSAQKAEAKDNSVVAVSATLNEIV